MLILKTVIKAMPSRDIEVAYKHWVDRNDTHDPEDGKNYSEYRGYMWDCLMWINYDYS